MQITIEIDNGIFNKIAVSGGSLEETLETATHAFNYLTVLARQYNPERVAEPILDFGKARSELER